MTKQDILKILAEERVRIDANELEEADTCATLMVEVDKELAKATLDANAARVIVLAKKRADLAKRAEYDVDADKHAIMGTRTRLHASLQAANPAPAAEPDEDPEMTHMRQKAHGKKLWAEVDRLVKEAGL